MPEISDSLPTIGFYYALLIVLAYEMPQELRCLADRQLDNQLTREVRTSLRLPRRIEVARFFAAIEADVDNESDLVIRILNGERVDSIGSRAESISDRLGKSQHAYEESGSKFYQSIVTAFLDRYGKTLSLGAARWLQSNRNASLPSRDEIQTNRQISIELLRTVSTEGIDETPRDHASDDGVVIFGSTSHSNSLDPQYREIELSAHYIYRRRTPSRVLYYRTLQAITEPISEFRVPFNLPNDLHEDIGAVEPLTNCSLAGFRFMNSTGTSEWTLALPDNSSIEPVAFSYELKLTSQVDDQPYIRHFARASGRRAVLEIQFDPAHSPLWVRSFEGLHYWDDVEDARLTKSISVSSAGVVRAEFLDYEPQDTFGIVFAWPDDSS
ncbi:MAG TPA: hypothetical protein VMF35_09615 [Acidimicrobiales bacterium]|nr:hypothetical protein [Acidimicrobiales bacterium]